MSDLFRRRRQCRGSKRAQDISRGIVVTLALFCGLLTHPIITEAQSVIPDMIYRGDSGLPSDLASVVDSVTSGSIVVLGEIHSVVAHHDKQKEFLRELHRLKPQLRIHVGMEFFEYPDQPSVDRFLTQEIDETDFLRLIRWGSMPFDLYRDQVLFGALAGGWTHALNAPREITRKIALKGLSALTAEEWARMPPAFELGSDPYRERFSETMEGHVPPDAIARYFEAQSTWDETMAWQATRVFAADPDAVLIIIVGGFHAEFFQGLPARLHARLNVPVQVIAQTNLFGLSEEEADLEVMPHSQWGPHGDWVWTSSEPSALKTRFLKLLDPKSLGPFARPGPN